MHIEAVLSREDIEGVLVQFLPLSIDLDDGKGGRIVTIQELFEVVMVPSVGLRLGCKAQVHWPVLGVEIPVAVKSLHLLVSPSVEIRNDRDSLVIRLRIEDADIAWLPGVIDATIKDRVNEELVDKHIELVWGFGKTLSVRFPLPHALTTAEAMALDVTRGRVEVTRDTLALAVSFSAKVFARPNRKG